jgi:hypothetical protein
VAIILKRNPAGGERGLFSQDLLQADERAEMVVVVYLM